eukprot:Tamp_16685.p1 GENE.Tamp_16685~~Tamp_16685.p1  ORF type:complete len:424 (-),score=25.91 Tamp_16685:173-1423(-)
MVDAVPLAIEAERGSEGVLVLGFLSLLMALVLVMARDRDDDAGRPEEATRQERTGTRAAASSFPRGEKRQRSLVTRRSSSSTSAGSTAPSSPTRTQPSGKGEVPRMPGEPVSPKRAASAARPAGPSGQEQQTHVSPALKPRRTSSGGKRAPQLEPSVAASAESRERSQSLCDGIHSELQTPDRYDARLTEDQDARGTRDKAARDELLSSLKEEQASALSALRQEHESMKAELHQRIAALERMVASQRASDRTPRPGPSTPSTPPLYPSTPLASLQESAVSPHSPGTSAGKSGPSTPLTWHRAPSTPSAGQQTPRTPVTCPRTPSTPLPPSASQRQSSRQTERLSSGTLFYSQVIANAFKETNVSRGIQRVTSDLQVSNGSARAKSSRSTFLSKSMQEPESSRSNFLSKSMPEGWCE